MFFFLHNRYIKPLGYTFLLCLYAATVSAQKHTDISTDDADTLTKALFNQIMQENATQEESQESFMRAMREQFPDVVPQIETYPSLRFYNQIFERDLANTIFFAPGSSYVSDVQKEKLDNIADSMNETPELTLIVEGHSSFNMQIEEPEDRLLYNRWISGRRAVQVWNYLTDKHKIDQNRIAIYAYDSQRPLNDDDSEQEKAQNRRVELRLTNNPIPLLSSNR